MKELDLDKQLENIVSGLTSFNIDLIVAEIKLAVAQKLKAKMPKEKNHFLEARIDSDYDHGYHLGETDGRNQALKEVHKILEEIC